MPIYTYKCVVCGQRWEQFNHVSDCYDGECCDTKAQKILDKKSMGKMTLQVYNYWCHGSGTRITGPEQRRRIMKEKGLEEYDGKCGQADYEVDI